MSMKKISEITLETTAKYQAKSKLNIRFWQQDLNTAELKFIITRNKFPLSLSSENVKVIIALENKENFISSEDFIIDSEVDGVARFAIPNDFMSVANGTVTGQVYVGTLDNDEVVVERQFTFEVENDLLSTIPSELKLQYIKTFSDLQNNVADSIRQLQEDMATLGDYIDNVNQATAEGLTAINNLVNSKIVEYNDNHTEKLAIIEDTVGDYVEDFLDQRTYIDTQYNDFKDQLLQSDAIVQSDTDNWQKYKLTDDDGTYPNMNLNNDLATLQGLAPGFYHGLETPINISGVSTSGFIEVSVNPSGTVKHIVYRPYNVNKEFVMRYYDEWSEWENKIDGLEKSIDAQSKANTAENNAKVYTDEKISTLHKLLFSGSVNGVNNSITLNDSYNNFDEIRLFYSTLGGRDSKIVKAKETNKIVIYSFNLTDSNGGNGDIIETSIDRVNSNTLKISNEVKFNLLNQTGGSTSGITITEIIGVKY